MRPMFPVTSTTQPSCVATWPVTARKAASELRNEKNSAWHWEAPRGPAEGFASAQGRKRAGRTS